MDTEMKQTYPDIVNTDLVDVLKKVYRKKITVQHAHDLLLEIDLDATKLKKEDCNRRKALQIILEHACKTQSIDPSQILEGNRSGAAETDARAIYCKIAGIVFPQIDIAIITGKINRDRTAYYHYHKKHLAKHKTDYVYRTQFVKCMDDVMEILKIEKLLS